MKKRNFPKRILCLFLLLPLLLLPVSCGESGRSFDEEEVLAAARELLPLAEELNEIYYGMGIRPIESEEKKTYLPARTEDLASFGITNVESLKQKTRNVFSAGYASLIERTKLSAVYDEGTVAGIARYYQTYETDGEEKKEGAFMVHTSPEIYLTDKLTYEYSTLMIDRAEGDTVYVTLSVTVENGEGETAEVSLRVGLIEESGGWRIDTPTYATYPIYKAD